MICTFLPLGNTGTVLCREPALLICSGGNTIYRCGDVGQDRFRAPRGRTIGSREFFGKCKIAGRGLFEQFYEQYVGNRS